MDSDLSYQQRLLRNHDQLPFVMVDLLWLICYGLLRLSHDSRILGILASPDIVDGHLFLNVCLLVSVDRMVVQLIEAAKRT